MSGWRNRKTHPLCFYLGSNGRWGVDAPSQRWVHLEPVNTQRGQMHGSLPWLFLLCANAYWLMLLYSFHTRLGVRDNYSESRTFSFICIWFMCILNHLLCSHLVLYHEVVHITLFEEKLMHMYIFCNLDICYFFYFASIIWKTTLCVLFENMKSHFTSFTVLTSENNPWKV